MSTDGKFDSDFGFTRLGAVFTNILSTDVLDDEFSIGTVGNGFVLQDAKKDYNSSVIISKNLT